MAENPGLMTELDEIAHAKAHNDAEAFDGGTSTKTATNAVVRDPADPALTVSGSPASNSNPHRVSWDGDDDPRNPMNWARTRKWTQVILVTLLTFVTSLGSSIFAPAVPTVMRDLHNDDASLDSFVVSVYVIGFAVGSLFIAPLTELYGRAVIYHITNVVFLGCTVGCALSYNVGMLIAFRFLSGVFGVASLAIGGGTISDVIDHDGLGIPMAIWSMGSLIPPVLAPVAGGYLDQYLSWRWCFWVVAIPMGLLTLLCFAFLRETYAPVLLKRKGAKLRKETSGDVSFSAGDDAQAHPSSIVAKTLLRPLNLLFTSPIVALLAFDTAVVYGYEYLIFTTLAFVFEEQYHLSSGSTGLTYLGTGIGTVLGVFTVGAAADKVDSWRKATGKSKNLELTLWPLCPAGFILPASILWYGWAVETHANVVVPIVGLGFFGFAMMAVFMPVSMYLVKAFDTHAASAISASTILRNILGAVLPLAGQGLYDALGYGWGNSLLAFIAVLLIPIPFLLIRFGGRLSSMDRHLRSNNGDTSA